MIVFNKPPYTGKEEQHLLQATRSSKMSGDGAFTSLCHQWFEEKYQKTKCLLTPSCTQALEMAAILINVQPGDEIIMPSYTFVSTANAFVLRGAKIVFVDIHPDTMNINESLLEKAISDKTKAIVPVHYAGVSCDMNKIMELANNYGVYVIEDAAQGMMSTYDNEPLGTIGHFGAFSFHETKNYTSGGEGGLLLINDQKFVERAEIIREKGTNRSRFFRGMVDKYSWVDLGSSYLPSELQAAYLYGQLSEVDEINNNRLETWYRYYDGLLHLEELGCLSLPKIPKQTKHNGHMFYIKLRDLTQRTQLIGFLKQRDIMAVFHYIPLHTSAAGTKFGRFDGDDIYTTSESKKLLRLPIYYGISRNDVESVIQAVCGFFK